MSWDLEDILEVAGGRRDRPQLIQVGHALVQGRATTGYFWSDGRIGATVGPGWVRIDRRRGVVGDGIRIDTRTLRVLVNVCSDWAHVRDGWAAFYYSSAGFPPGYGGYKCYYQAPGKSGTLTVVGRRAPMSGKREGKELVGKDEVVPIAHRPVGYPAIVAEIWRCGEQHGPAAGSLVGLRYKIDRDTYVDAHRNEARVWRKRRGVVWLEPGNESFVAALLDVVAKTQRKKQRR